MIKFPSLEILKEPRFKHDCLRCTFIGQYGEDDIWLCYQGRGFGTSLIRRHSSDPSDYWSNPLMMATLGRMSMGQQEHQRYILDQFNLLNELAMRRIIDFQPRANIKEMQTNNLLRQWRKK